MLLVDERCLQPDLVGGDRIVPVASVAASRNLDASSSTQRAATQIAAATRLHQHRPSGICRVVPACTWRAGRFEDRQAGDRDPLASCRLSSVLALEIKTAHWPSKDPAGNPSAHSRDQSRQPIVGRTTDSWRASQARHRCRANHRCKVYGEGEATAVPRVEVVPSQSRRRHRVDGPIRGPDNLIPTALRVADTTTRSPPNPVAGSDRVPNGGVDFAPVHPETYCWKVAARYIIRDRDAVYGAVFIAAPPAM